MEPSMISEPTTVPSRRSLLLAGSAAIAIAIAVALYGITDRSRGEAVLASQTDAAAIPIVALAKLDHGTDGGNLILPGKIQPFTRAMIYARVSGYLKDWKADIGTSVKAGQLLASIDTPDLDQQLNQAKADLATADANERLAALTAQRWNALLASQSVAQQAVDEKQGDAAAKKAIVDAALANVGRLEVLEGFKAITAPFDGVVTARKTDIGALVNAGSSAGQELFELSDLHKVRIYVQVPQAFSAELRPGLQAIFRMPQYPGRQFTAILVTMSNALETNSASMLVELQADNPDGVLAAGAYCEVEFELPGDGKLIRVPATALVPADRGVEVAVLGADGKAAFKQIQLGRDLGDEVEVLSGISAADRVIDNPPETLEAGEAVQLADAGAAAPTPTPRS
jgi:RND family efflux transporter MFP subunit